MALGAGVGAELGVAAHAHRPAFVTDEPLPPEVVSAVETLRAVRHRHSGGIQSGGRGDGCGAGGTCAEAAAAAVGFNSGPSR